MTITADAKDVYVYTGAIYGLKGIFDASGNQIFKDENTQNTYDWFSEVFAKWKKAETVQDIADYLSKNLKTPYTLTIDDHTLTLSAESPFGGHYIETCWGVELGHAEVN